MAESSSFPLAPLNENTDSCCPSQYVTCVFSHATSHISSLSCYKSYFITVCSWSIHVFVSHLQVVFHHCMVMEHSCLCLPFALSHMYHCRDGLAVAESCAFPLALHPLHKKKSDCRCPSQYVTCVTSHATSRVSSLYTCTCMFMEYSCLCLPLALLHYCRDRLAVAESSSFPLALHPLNENTDSRCPSRYVTCVTFHHYTHVCCLWSAHISVSPLHSFTCTTVETV